MNARCDAMDRPTRTALLRFFALQRLLTALRYPGLPATGRSRFGFWAGLVPPEVFSVRTVEDSQLAHAVFRSSSSAAYAGGRVGTCRGSCIAPFYLGVRDVPLPAVTRFAAPPEEVFFPATLVGFFPFAVLFLPGGFRSVSARHSPRAVSELPPRSCFFSRDRPTDTF